MRNFNLAEQIVLSNLSLHCDTGYNPYLMGDHGKRCTAWEAISLRKR
jgi:hypothetical protein